MTEALDALQRDLDREFSALPPWLRGALERVPEQLGGRFVEASSWSRRLAPLTLLYPWLQAEVAGLVAMEPARPYCLAHTLLVMHNFLQDRRADRQAIPDEDQMELSVWLEERGLQILRGQSRNLSWLDELAEEARSDFASAHRDSYLSKEGTSDTGRERRIAAGLASHGRVAPLALLKDQGAGLSVLAEVRDLFDQLTLGLQWIDDLEDWAEDLYLGDRNLLLTRLRRRVEPDEVDSEVEKVGAALVAHKILDEALLVARSLIEGVAARQRALGCGLMEPQVRERLERLDRFTAELARARGTVLIEALGLDGRP